MSFLNNFKISQILAVAACLIMTILVVSTVVNNNSMVKIEQESAVQMKEVLPNPFDFLELQLSVIQIQQWLTDVSATRAAEGFDVGVEMAKKFKFKLSAFFCIVVNAVYAIHEDRENSTKTDFDWDRFQLMVAYNF